MTLMPRRLGGDYVWGNVDSRELTLRPITPLQMCEWHPIRGFRFTARSLLVPRNWWKTAKDRWSWCWELRFYRDSNHRCWCAVGRRVFWRVVVCGFGFVIFYSRFTGSVPCPCDKAIEEVKEESNA